MRCSHLGLPVLVGLAMLWATLALAAPVAAPAPQTAPGTSPLLQEGKKTLFQRVVSHPGAKLYAGAEAGAATLKEAKTFTVYYIYARQGDRLAVGVNSNAVDGWLDANTVTEWPQAITMLFTERMGRMPILFFKDHKALVDTCRSDDLGTRVKNLNEQVQKAVAGHPAQADLPVLAAEPDDDKGAVSRKRFYLMPVLAVDDQFGEQTKLLQVASIDPGTAGTAGAPKTPATPQEKTELRTAIAFVVDTTISMKPYIEQTKTMLRSIYDELEKSPQGDKVAFAVVAYRNNPEKSPGLDYLSQVISDFKTVRNRAELETALAGLNEATASSHSFDEDALAGVKTAVDKLSWDKYGSRVMLLVSDAGFLPGSDPTGSTRLDAQEMADYLKTNHIWMTATHVKTPAGKRDHASAEKAYRELTRLDSSSSSYVAIDASTPAVGAAEFGKVGLALASGYRNMVEATASGKLLAKPADPADLTTATTPEERARQIAEVSGYAMQLDFIGSREGNRAPSVVSAWIADADLEKLSRAQQGAPVLAAQPAVLLTKNQLSDLSSQLKIIIEQAERTKRTDSRDFFESILSASAQLARDPSRFSHQPGQNLAQSGALGEYLEGLPYKSEILLMREEDWYNKSTGEQTAFINRLKSRLARYEEYDKDRANWESFGATNPSDWVYRVPLNMLP
ncbi:MAG: vWA domain-containing protein [Bilophila sp.]